ncbi:MAG: hypothetical protein JW902_16340 [Syntrophaceae bacterium]|nr:hypothetical protein [Syntrophaceae bacterium]
MKETCFNLWYYLDRQQNITAIAAKAYFLEGNDQQKGRSLHESSGTDYNSLVPYKISPLHYSMLKQLGVEEVFAPEFQRIHRESPKGTILPDDKLYYATPLFDFGEGFVPVEIGNGFIKERD